MQSVEPATGLVHAFGYEVGRCSESRGIQAAKPFLGIRHGAGIEPDVDKVRFASHFATGCRYKVNLIHIGTVKIYLVVVFEAHIGRVEAFVFQRIGCHDAGGNGFFDFCVKLFYRADADFLFAVFGTPDGQRSAPVTAAAEVPVLDILKPLAEAAGTGGGWLPGDFLVQGHHFILYGRCLDEPAIQRVIKDGKICPPAVGIAVDVFLDFERAAVGLHHY